MRHGWLVDLFALPGAFGAVWRVCGEWFAMCTQSSAIIELMKDGDRSTFIKWIAIPDQDAGRSDHKRLARIINMSPEQYAKLSS